MTKYTTKHTSKYSKPFIRTQPEKEVKVLTPTKEQQDILNTAKTGTNLAIHAFAGTGKTSTCVLLAKNLIKPSLYVAFNKSIAEEASSKFPSHVECRTIHSLAYRKIVDGAMRGRLQGFFERKELDYMYIQHLEGDLREEVKSGALDVVKGYCQSSYTDILEYGMETDYDATVCFLAELFWKDISKLGSKVKITHDVYLKLYQLSNPILPYEVIYLDEAQDSNPVILDIILRQKAQIVLVGDQYQAIYEWRGAINAMANLPSSFTSKYLTESFRFTKEIASLATKLLSILGNDKEVIGRAEESTYNIMVNTEHDITKAIIVRANSTLIYTLLRAEEEGKKVYVLADLKELWGKLYHIQSLFYKEQPRYPDKELSQYKVYADLIKAADSIPELKKLLNLTVSLSNGGLTANINKIKSVILSEENKDKADFTLTTAHKSKGLEWDTVDITEDMIYLRDDQTILDALLDNQTLNLAYVALTRAKYKVNLPSLLQDVIDNSENLRVEYSNRQVI